MNLKIKKYIFFLFFKLVSFVNWAFQGVLGRWRTEKKLSNFRNAFADVYPSDLYEGGDTDP